VEEEYKLTEFYANYYSKTGQWNKLDEFINRNIAKNPDGVNMYFYYILSHLIYNYPEKLPTYIKKGMLMFPQEENLAQFAVGYANEYNKYKEVLQLFNEVRPNLRYDISGYETYLTEPQTTEKSE